MLAEQRALLWLCESAQGTFINYTFGSLVKTTDFDWQRFFQLANRHGLVPLAYRNASQLITDLVPADIFEKLKNRYQQIAQRNFVMMAASLKLQSICKNNDIHCSFFKGSALAIQLYNDPTLRSYCDIDVLISQPDQKKLHSKLIKIGFTNKFTPKQFSYQLKHGKDISYRHPKKNILLECHFKYTHYQHRLAALKNSPKQYATLLQWNNATLPTLEPHAHCCYLAFHGCFSGWQQLKWLLDFYHCFELCEFKMLIDTSHTLGVPFFVEHAILLTQRIFNGHQKLQSPSQKASQGADYAYQLISKNNLSTLQQRLIKYKMYFSVSCDKKEKLHCITHCFDAIEPQWNAIKIPDRFFYLYFLFRPFHWIYKFSIGPLLRKLA